METRTKYKQSSTATIYDESSLAMHWSFDGILYLSFLNPPFCQNQVWQTPVNEIYDKVFSVEYSIWMSHYFESQTVTGSFDVVQRPHWDILRAYYAGGLLQRA